MFLSELEKYPGNGPMIAMYEDLEEDAFILLLEYSTIPELNRILKMVPLNRPDIRRIVASIIAGKG